MTTTTTDSQIELNDDEMLVFVYGTLKRGYGNHRLLTTAEFVKEATLSGFELFDSGFPVATPAKNGDESFVRGEVFKIKRSVHLRSLDGLEGEGSMYHREVHTTEDGTEVSVYVGHDNFWGFDRMKKSWESTDGNRISHEWKR